MYIKDDRSKINAYMFMTLTLPLLYAMHSDICSSILWCLFCFGGGLFFRSGYNPPQLFRSPDPLGLCAWPPGSVASSSKSYASLPLFFGGIQGLVFQSLRNAEQWDGWRSHHLHLDEARLRCQGSCTRQVFLMRL